jgi:pSer/pThr/pTyr-binding forkhead associated (FHA) protein
MGVRITVQSLWTEVNPSTFVYEFAQSRIVVGRSRSADVQLPHAAVSGAHASVRASDAGYVLVDEGSTNGTRVNEIPLAPGRPKTLRSHDLVDLGGYRLTLEVGVPVARAMSASLTADYARRLLAERLSGEREEALASKLDAIQRAPDERVDLLPIPKNTESEPPPTRESSPRASSPDDPGVQPTKLKRSEVAVYALAALVVAVSIVAMALLTRS